MPSYLAAGRCKPVLLVYFKSSLRLSSQYLVGKKFDAATSLTKQMKPITLGRLFQSRFDMLIWFQCSSGMEIDGRFVNPNSCSNQGSNSDHHLSPKTAGNRHSPLANNVPISRSGHQRCFFLFAF